MAALPSSAPTVIASQVAAVTQALLNSGFSAGDIRKVMGGNVLRVLRAGLAPS